uniref:RING-type domain-containing protein n=1 Tax=Monodelphis domestica TaxID=13616 RepID=A0A5F8HLQ0_MONDO
GLQGTGPRAGVGGGRAACPSSGLCVQPDNGSEQGPSGASGDDPDSSSSEEEEDGEEGSDWESSEDDGDSTEGEGPEVALGATPEPPKGQPEPLAGAGVSSDEDAESCPICLNVFRGQAVGTPENCAHYFCLDCIVEWSKNANSCPVDRILFKWICIRARFGGKVLKKIPVESQKAPQAEEEGEDPTFCEVCGRSDREDRLLLCDGCDAGSGELPANQGSPLSTKRGILSQSALRSHQPVGRPIFVGLSRRSVPATSGPEQDLEVAPVPDLLGSILSGQNLLMMSGSDVVINRDGSLTARKAGKAPCCPAGPPRVAQDPWTSGLGEPQPRPAMAVLRVHHERGRRMELGSWGGGATMDPATSRPAGATKRNEEQPEALGAE